MHPLVPIIMALGVILFVVGILVYARLASKKINIVKFRGKEYVLWHFYFVTVGLGIALVMLSVMLPKYVSYQSDQTVQSTQPQLSGNLKYELDAALKSLNLNDNTIHNAIERFQVEYQAALQKNDKNVMELLSLELTFRIRTELQNQNYPDNQIQREVERIIAILKQSGKQGNGK